MVDDGRTTDGRTTDGRRTDGRTTEHGYTIISPCEPDGSGELIKLTSFKSSERINEKMDGPYRGFGYF